MFKELFLAPLLMLSLSAQANPINDQLHKVFNDVQRAMGTHATLDIEYDDTHAEGNTVTVDIRDIRLFQRDHDIFAALVGHELAHIKNGDVLRGCTVNRCKWNEARADKDGVRGAIRAGYNGMKMCQAIDLMKREFGEPPKDDDHPSWVLRKRNIGCGR